MANREYYDLIIIGGGAAGLSAGIYALHASMRTVLIENTTAGGQITKSDIIENYPGCMLSATCVRNMPGRLY